MIGYVKNIKKIETKGLNQMELNRLENEVKTVLEDSKMENQQKSIVILSLFKQYIADHDNELFNKIGKVFNTK